MEKQVEAISAIKRIAIQGEAGAFHDIAAQYYFGAENIEIVPSLTFKDLFHTLKHQHADYGIMAIENLVAGSILPNYGLLRESNMKIIGENIFTHCSKPCSIARSDNSGYQRSLFTSHGNIAMSKVF